MPPSGLLHGFACLLLCAGTAARAQDEAALRDAVSVVALDMSAEAMVAYCEGAAPGVGGLRAQWRSWRERAMADEIAAGLGPDRLRSARAGMAGVATNAVEKLKSLGPAAQVCPQLPGWFGEGPFETRSAYPAAYAALPPAGGAPVATTPVAKPAARPAAPKAEAAPARGLAPGEIHGLLYHAYGATGVGGYEFREETFLLLKDGTYYRGKTAAPDRLDAAVSRRQEPQLWGRWRQAAGGFEILPQDAQGQPKGDWRKQPGRLVDRWRAGQTLDATYTSKAFNGAPGLGGVYSSTSYRFTPDGRFERIGYRQGGSGSMAAATGFSASASGYSDGRGSQRSAGGGNAAVFAGSRSQSADGASHRGAYRLDGLTLELRYDDGRVERVLCAPWSDDLKSIYMFGRTFSRG